MPVCGGAPLWLRIGEDAANRSIKVFRSAGRSQSRSMSWFRSVGYQRVPGGIGSGVATQEVSKAAEVESGISSGLARDWLADPLEAGLSSFHG
jgi:hypothetical protein